MLGGNATVVMRKRPSVTVTALTECLLLSTNLLFVTALALLSDITELQTIVKVHITLFYCIRILLD